MATSPETHPSLYATVLIGGRPSPGVVTLSGYERKHDWKVDKPEGAFGAVTCNKGPAVSSFTAAFYLADLEDVAAWDSFQAMLSASVETSKPKAFAVYHPDLARNKITDVVVEEIGIMAYDGKGGATVTCKFIEYKPPKPRPAVLPAAAKKSPDKFDPNAQRKAELAALLEQAKQP